MEPALINQESCPSWIKIAKKELGVKEIAGKEANPQILAYHRATMLSANSDEVAWCSAFVNWVMREAGIKGTGSALARSWLKWGRRLKYEEPGCIVVLERGGSKWQGHVGFYIGKGKDPSFIKILGGNQNDQVSIEEFSRHRILGFRMPK